MKKITIFLFVVLCSFLMGCSSPPPEKITLEGTAKDAILAFSEAKTDRLMEGFNYGDYAMFSQDFDAEMIKNMPDTEFYMFQLEKNVKLGLYISREVKNVIQEGDVYGVHYEAVFEQDANVKMLVIFRAAEPHQIGGLWFDK